MEPNGETLLPISLTLEGLFSRNAPEEIKKVGPRLLTIVKTKTQLTSSAGSGDLEIFGSGAEALLPFE